MVMWGVGREVDLCGKVERRVIDLCGKVGGREGGRSMW